MNKDFEKLDKSLVNLKDELSEVSLELDDIWKGVEVGLEKSIKNIKGLDNELSKVLASVASNLLKNTISGENNGLGNIFSSLADIGGSFLGSSSPVNLNMTVNTPDANSFKASQPQLLTDATLAMNKAKRNL